MADFDFNELTKTTLIVEMHPAGPRGRSVSSITSYYLITDDPSSVSKDDPGWSETPPEMTVALPYLMAYMETIYDDYSGTAVDVGPYIAGTRGVGLEALPTVYQASLSGAEIPSGAWSETVPETVAQGEWLWSKTVFAREDGTSTTQYVKTYQGVDGYTPQKGVDYFDGVSVVGQVSTYQQGDTADTVPDGSWLSSPPVVAQGKFLWTKTVTTLSDASEFVGYIVARQGVDGYTPIKGEDYDDGQDGYTPVKGVDYDDGADGRGIASTVTTYGASASGTDPDTVASWESTPMAVAQGNYLWTKTVDTYTDATTSTRYSVARMGVDGEDGDVDDLAGAGRTTETVKGNADDIALKANSTDLSNLAGTGRTTETVKANADAIANRARTTNNGALQEVPDKNRFYPLLANAAGTLLARHQTERWTGSAWTGAGDNIGFGVGALQNNTGSVSVAVGHQALQNNDGNNCAGLGYQALQNNTGLSSAGFGQHALQNNTGAGSVGLGRASLQNAAGGIAIGYESMQNSVGSSNAGLGYQALQNNTGSYSNGVGFRALLYNQTDGNIAVGYDANGLFYENPAGNKSCQASEINTALNRATITGHGFGAANAAVNVKYASTTGTAIGGLTVGGIFQVRIIDADTVEFIQGSMPRNLTSQGSGEHTFTPQFSYSNTTCLGNSATPNRSNQVVLGNTSVDTVKMGGAPRTPASATAPGVRGETCWDANYFYICVATSIWKRIPLESWA